MKSKVSLLREKLEILNELQIRQARVCFWSFRRYMDVLFFIDGKRHLKQVADALQDITEGKNDKLMISMPPRAGKSYIVSMYAIFFFI